MRRLRIGIDAHILGKRKGGVETCLLAIVSTLARLDFRNEYFIYVTGKCPLKAVDLPSNFHLRYLPIENPGSSGCYRSRTFTGRTASI